MAQFTSDPQQVLEFARKQKQAIQTLKESANKSTAPFKEIMEQTGVKNNVKTAEGYGDIIKNYDGRFDEMEGLLDKLIAECDQLIELAN